jgi:hypothetical protein
MVKLVIGMATRNRFIFGVSAQKTDSNIHRLWQQISLLWPITLVGKKIYEVLEKSLKVER